MKNKKQLIIEKISANAQKFDASINQNFICPTCLKHIPWTSIDQITEAHIIPKSANGKQKTYLCKACNSYFGRNQDLWLGDYLLVINSNKWLFASKQRNKKVIINGVEVTGEVEMNDNQQITLRTYSDLISPKTANDLKLAETSGKMQFTINFPILNKEAFISVGFLTAAYLLWFKELGYSWVFQSHLDIVRQQILSPSTEILRPIYVIDLGEKNYTTPQIGFFEADEHSYPCAVISDKLVLLPSFNENIPYNHFQKTEWHSKTIEYELIRISNYHDFPDPTGIVYRDDLIVYPDPFLNETLEPRIFKYNGDGTPRKILHVHKS